MTEKAKEGSRSPMSPREVRSRRRAGDGGGGGGGGGEGGTEKKREGKILGVRQHKLQQLYLPLGKECLVREKIKKEGSPVLPVQGRWIEEKREKKREVKILGKDSTSSSSFTHHSAKNV